MGDEKKHEAGNSRHDDNLFDAPQNTQYEEQNNSDVKDEGSDTQQDAPKSWRSQEAGMGSKQPLMRRLKHWYGHHKVWAIIITGIVVLSVLAAVPFTRYKIAGLMLSQTATIEVLDSQTHKPVTSAMIMLGGVHAQTNSKGVAYVKAHVGSRLLSVSKAYYHASSKTILVPIMRPKTANVVFVQASGRQVPVSVVNTITGKAVENITIKTGDTEAITDKNGQATVVLAANKQTVTATLSGTGYNSHSVNITVADSAVAANKFSVTSTGKIYFLSNRSGNIDVVKTDLDGNNRQTVLPGTGKEDTQNTVLLAARDWKYLVLLSKRDGGDNPKVFLVNTSNDAVTTIDEGNAGFSFVGWAGHNFVYQVNRKGLNAWQPNAVSIKSYDADANKLATLVNTNATGSNNGDAEYETIFNTALLGNLLVYNKTWYKYPGYLTVSGKQNVVASVHADGSNAATLKTADAGTTSYFTSFVQTSPDELYLTLQTNNDSSYFEVDADANIKPTDTPLTNDEVQNYITYLASPSGKQTLWADVRDGKNSLFVGDAEGKNGQEVLSKTEQTAYAWYTDNYVLSAKSGSELYIMSAKGGQQIKITDYYKPAVNFRGYGGGYGGL